MNDRQRNNNNNNTFTRKLLAWPIIASKLPCLWVGEAFTTAVISHGSVVIAQSEYFSSFKKNSITAWSWD